MSFKNKFREVVLLAFDGDEDNTRGILGLYAKPPPCNGDDDHDDAEMTMLYEEMAVIDQVNASDLKAWKTT